MTPESPSAASGRPPSGSSTREPGVPADARGIRTFRHALLGYFDEHRRDLPWRRTSDPYRILVSEVMLQQTRVDTVVPFYRKWLQRFPDLASLARAEEDEVLRYWQGLGYYRRARNLHQMAREVVADWGGEVPDDAKALRALPGVGDYTAGAVASIAFGEAVPAVDGNVRRVFSRLLDDPAPGGSLLAREVGRLVDPERPGDFNQALMELGATVCTPRSPRCEACPVESFCAARARGTVAERPRPPRRKSIPHLVEAVAVILRLEDSGWEVLLRQRPPDGLLARMWECPGAEVAPPGTEGRVLESATALAMEFSRPASGPDADGGAWGTAPVVLPAVDHLFSHRRVTYRPVRFIAGSRGRNGPGLELPSHPPHQWVPLDSLERVALPRAQQRMLGDAAPAADV